MSLSAQAGGDGGWAQYYVLPTSKQQETMDVIGVTAGCGDYVDYLILRFSDKTRSENVSSPRFGGMRGGIYDFNVPLNDKISYVQVYYGRWVDGISIRTENGNTFECGKLKGRMQSISIGHD